MTRRRVCVPVGMARMGLHAGLRLDLVVERPPPARRRPWAWRRWAAVLILSLLIVG